MTNTFRLLLGIFEESILDLKNDVLLRTPATPILYTTRRRRSADSKPTESALNRTHLRETHPYDVFNIHRLVTVDNLAYQSTSQLAQAYEMITLQRTRRQLFVGPGVSHPQPSQAEKISPLQSSAVAVTLYRGADLFEFTWGGPITVSLSIFKATNKIQAMKWLYLNKDHFMFLTETIKEVLQLTTDIGVPGPVSDLHKISVGINDVDIKWTPPSQSNGPIISAVPY
ncbi:unnamed protein product [Protopolystoma xenopodis]|uniref:Fibronectin type-III domain-containing protein n=1 Tax=Protopolystoma xenopodis TaxID=117903 RepID=A0A3S5AQC2_9PLAT|nr:unnamed protein product [Protopolystoma xenopodis]